MIYQMTITLQDIDKPIWRRFQVDAGITFHQLHKVLQVVMGWEEYHLYSFDFTEKLILLPDPTFPPGGKVEYNARREIVQQHLYLEGQSLIYTYDLGDNWEHKVVLEKILTAPADYPLPVCLQGERSCPQEDCGGVAGFEHIQEILGDSDHPEYEETVVWLKTGYDPERFSCAEVNVLLQERATSLNPKQPQVQAPSKQPPKLTVAGLKKKLRNSSQQELVQLLAECFASSRQAQQFLTVKLLGEPAIEALFKIYGKKVRDEFFPARGFGKLRLGEAEKAIKEFEQITSSKKYTLELMLLYVEMGVDFTNTYGDIDARFYENIENMYVNVINMVNEDDGYELFEEYEERIAKVVEDADGIGWGFYDTLQNLNSRIRWM